MKNQVLIEQAKALLPKYLLRQYRIGKPINSNHLRKGQLVLGISHDWRGSFYMACEFLGFATLFSLYRDVCREESLIPETPENQSFYDRTGSPMLVTTDPYTGEETLPVFFGRTRDEPVWTDALEESIREFNEGYATPLSDEGFEAREISDPIFIGRSLRKLKKPYILLMRDNETSKWLTPDHSRLSWFSLLPR